MKKLLVLMCIWLYSLTAHATVTLADHIQKHCKAGCVEEQVILNAVTMAADRYDVDFKLVLAIITVESAFIVKARNQGNAGLMQVLLRYHKAKFSGNVYSVNDNVQVGTSIFRDCLDRRKGMLDKALRCYNSGSISSISKHSRMYSNKVRLALKEVKRISF